MLVRTRQTLPLRRLTALGASIPGIPSRTPLTANSRSWRKPLGGRLAAFERTLATALDQMPPGEEIPYEGLPSPFGSHMHNPNHPLYEIRSFDGFSPLRVADPMPPVPRKKITDSGMPGQLDELVALYDACLKVGRLERSALVLKRIATFNVIPSQDLIGLHNRYLREKVANLQAEPTQKTADDLHKWFELEIRAELLPQTPETIAYMLKTAFLTARGTKLETLVERYMEMLPNDAGLGELHLGDILSDGELAAITQICPNYSLAYDGPSYASLEDQVEEGDVELPLEAAEPTRKVSLARTPDVLGTPQKGMGLKSIKRSLSLFDDMSDGDVIANLSPSEQREIQARLESDCIDAAMERWRDENEALKSMGLSTGASNAKLSPKLHDWHVAIEAYLENEFRLIDEAMTTTTSTVQDAGRCLYGPFLQQSTPKRLAAVTILSTLSCMGMPGNDKGLAITSAVQHVAKIVEEDLRVQRKEKLRAASKAQARNAKLLRKAQAAPDAPREQTAPVEAPKTRRRKKASASATPAPDAPSEEAAPAEKASAPATGLPDGYVGEGYGLTDLEHRGYWPPSIRLKVGAVLLTAITECARITAVKESPETGALISQSQPAFVHGSKLKRGKKVGMIQANPVLSELIRQEPRAEFLARHLPMVVEPEPWVKWDKGGYLESPTPLVRVKMAEAEQRIYTQAALQRGDMDQMLKGLDVLGKTAWKINRPVFNVMLEVWNTGEEFETIPPLHPTVQYPPEPDLSEDPTLRSAWIRQMKTIDNEKCSLHSVRCNMNFQMEVAKAFREQTFYFPHNIDFRGRAYPIPTYLNHMGADNVRGLLRFAKGKALGEKGLRWLKVHLANVYGFDKASLTDRENFAMQNLDNIYDSALKPLTGNMWWRQAEDPWQCLAACFELKAALDSPDPTSFVSHLPVHQDGTCNGLQHYAALGGDVWGARQVNLEPGDRPADVYSAVANLVEESMAVDAAAGESYAKALVGKMTRKVVKQTVMTNVYGVTFAGAKKQILKQLEALYPDLAKETGIEPLYLASYAGRKVFGALSSMFEGAHSIQRWLGAMGGRVCRSLTPDQLKQIVEEHRDPSKAAPKTKKTKAATSASSLSEFNSQFRSTIVWTTPLRLPVVQPYRSNSLQTINTCIQELAFNSSDRSDPVNPRKQLQAFPPNFIHSLDASHMVLSALECDHRGLTFAAVHDSFWTHAADIDTMNEVLRDAFIRIHSDDVIGRLAEEFKMRYKDSFYLAKVPATTKIGQAIIALRKTSKKKSMFKEELVAEYERSRLLQSQDPEERAKGEEMITPASIFSEMRGTEDIEPALLADDAQALAEASQEAEMEDAAQLESSQPSSVKTVANDSKLDDGLKAHVAKLKEVAATRYFTSALSGTLPQSSSKNTEMVPVWLPLTFPAIPAKGDFDVRRLKDSQYFFS